MIFLKFCRVSKIKEICQRLPLVSSSINRMTKIPQRCKMGIQSHMIILQEKRQKKYLLIDNVPKDSFLVYSCSIHKLVVIGYHTSFFLSLLILSGIYYFTDHELEYPLYEPNNNPEDKREVGRITIFSEVEHFALHIGLLLYNLLGFLWCRRTALRIWYHGKTNSYYMILPELFSKTGRQLVVKPGEMKIRFGYNSLPLIRNLHVMKGWRYYINEDNFHTPVEYVKFIGESSK